MWAFIPANANWIGATPRCERCANNGTHADGVLLKLGRALSR
jgi:hypothetical protein